MNSRKLQANGIVLGVALLVATGLPVAKGADRVPAAKTAPPKPVSEGSIAAARQLSDAFAEVAEYIKPSVVTVYSEKTVKMPRFQWPFGEGFPFQFFFGDEDNPTPRRPQRREYKFKQSGMGSGVIIDKEGRILTNNHVVQGMDEIKVKLASGATHDVVVVGADPSTDLAVIKIKDQVPRDLVAAGLGDSDAMRVGDWVLAVGAPFGYKQTVTAGIISAKGRTGVDPESGKYEDFLQTDAAINPGNSGGPLVNLRGEVVGINTAMATGGIGQSAGVGFAIPINMARPVVRDLIKSGKVTRGMLGVGIQPVTEDLARHFGLGEAQGAIVTQVAKGSGAEAAGVKVGDVITRFDGHEITDTDHLRNLVAATTPGTKVEVVVLRDGKERTLEAKVGELTAESAAAAGGETPTRGALDIGMQVETLTPEKAKAAGYEGERGVLVTAVDDEGPAAQAGIQPGDLVTDVNKEKVTSAEDFNRVLSKAKGAESVLMLVKHQGISRFAIVRLK